MKTYEPLNVPKRVTDDVWIVDGPLISFGVAGVKMPFPTRMTIIRLRDASLWLHSPTAPDPALLASITALGPVHYLIAPNPIHYWWIPDWQRQFPGAVTYAAPGVATRAERHGRTFRIDHTLGADSAAETAWAETIACRVVESRFMSEAVFLHRPSRTLILTDLIENFEPQKLESLWLRFLTWAGAVQDPAGSMPRDMRLGFGPEARTRLREHVRAMIAWRPERIILAHGRWYERDGTAELRRAFEWLDV